MAKAKKLPSGQWRALVYSHTELIDGKQKRKYESFTADTKKEAEFLAAQFLINKSNSSKFTSLTLGEAMELYIKSKSNILSSSTLRGYNAVRRNYLKSIIDIPLNKLTQSKIQNAINIDASIHSAKTVKNAHGLLSATISAYCPNSNFKITLPKCSKNDIAIPTDNDICQIITAAKGTNLFIPILLSAMCSLRRSEICALQWRDIDFKTGILYVKRAMVIKEALNSQPEQWVIKPPKTFKSRREILMPCSLINELKIIKGSAKPSDYVVDIKPNIITNQFPRLLNKNGLPHFRFHDLRHYNASVMLMENIPDKYAMERGGWSTMSVMKERYQHTFTEEKIKQEQIINNHFDKLMQHEMQHKN